MKSFPHLKFVQKEMGRPRFSGGGGKNAKSEINKSNRKDHSTILNKTTTKIKSDWTSNFKERDTEKLADLNEEIVPIFLNINPEFQLK